MIGFIATFLLVTLGLAVALTVLMGVVIWFAADPDGRPPNSERH